MGYNLTWRAAASVFLLLIAATFSGPSQAITTQNSAGHGWWAGVGGGNFAGPFPDGISAAMYAQRHFFPDTPASECNYNYNIRGYPITASCRGFTAIGFVRPGSASLVCSPGEWRTHGEGGCLRPPLSNKKICMNDTGNPIDLVSGNKHQSITDFTTHGSHPLGLSRTYNSEQSLYAAKLGFGRFGKGWRTAYDSTAFYFGTDPATPTNIHIFLPDGREAVFVANGGVMKPAYWKKSTNTWTVPRTDVDESITLIGGTIWRYVGPDDTAMSFNLTGQLTEIRDRDGYSRSLAYDAAGRNTMVTDNLGRSINFTFNSLGLAQTATDPGGRVYKYFYKDRFVTVPETAGLPPVANHPEWALEKVVYPDATPASDSDNPSLIYHYEDAGHPFALTGVTDEKAVRFATWAYDAQGRAVSSQHAGGAELTSISYNDAANTRTVTNPLGKQAIYQLESFQDQLRITQIAGQPSANCVAADTSFVYDANGYVSQETDGKGNITTYVRNARGQETSRTEAFGAPQTRTITTT